MGMEGLQNLAELAVRRWLVVGGLGLVLVILLILVLLGRI